MDKENMIDVIHEYGGYCSTQDCKNCDYEQLEECYYKANNTCNSIFAESIDYGGYDSEEEFWEQLFD